MKGGVNRSKWTKGSILTKIIGTYKSEMPGNSAVNYVTFHEFQSSYLLWCQIIKKFVPYQSVMLLLLSNNINKHSPWMLSLEIFWSACAAAAADYRQIRCRPSIPTAAS